MLEKKIVISKNIYERLINDKAFFNMTDISDNEFLVKIILNTYDYINSDDYYKLISDMKENPIYSSNKLVKGMNIDDENFKKDFTEIVSEVIENEMSLESKKRTDTKTLFIRETKSTVNELLKLLNKAGAPVASKFFVKLILRYMYFPQYIRERILFNRIYEDIKLFSKGNKTCNISRGNNTYYAKIYDLLPGKEEFYNYVIVYGRNIKYSENVIMSFKLSSIRYIFGTKENIEITKEIKEEIESRISIPEFTGYESKEFTVYFDKYGENLLNIFYKDRPVILSKDTLKRKYVLFSSESQLVSYLKSFGWHALPVDKNIQDKLKDFYMKGLYLFDKDLLSLDDEKIKNELEKNKDNLVNLKDSLL